MSGLDLDRAAETFAQAVDGTVGLEEEFSLLHPPRWRWCPASKRCARPPG